MINITAYSQNDPKWKNVKHGTSSKTIGQTGCTITNLASLLSYFKQNFDPKSVNDLLTKNKGYYLGNLVIWSQFVRIFGLKGYKRVTKYNNADVSWNVYIMKRPVLVEVIAPKGVPGGRHWVLFLGDRKCLDPWTGLIESTSKYSPTGYCVIW
jgi:hypothetical protein